MFYAQKYKVDYVICDFGPSAGIINRTLLYSCDLILPLFQCDSFSASAANGLLKSVLPDMIRDLERYKDNFLHMDRSRRAELEAIDIDFNRPFPQLLPFLVTNYHLSKKRFINQRFSNHVHMLEQVVEDPEIEDKVKSLYIRDKDGKVVVPFLKNVPKAYSIAHDCAHPAVLMLQIRPNGKSVLEHNYEESGYDLEAKPMCMNELSHVKKAFNNLANFLYQM
eukprot:1170061-Pyramimonas_sp.AAC.1